MCGINGGQSTVHSCTTSTAVQVNVLLATQHASPPNSSTTTTPFNCISAQYCLLPPHLNVKYTANTQYPFILRTANLLFPLLFPPSSPSAPPTFTLGTTECVRVQQNQSPLAALLNHSTIQQPAHVRVLGAALPPLGAHQSLPPVANKLHSAHNRTSCWQLYCCDTV